MENNELLSILNAHYPIIFTKIELLRKGGNSTYTVYTDKMTDKYFLKIVGSAFSDTIKASVYVNLYLQEHNFSVPKIIMTSENKPFIEVSGNCIILYEFLETAEIDVKNDTEEIGLLLGQLHKLMGSYKSELIIHDKYYYIERYLDILKKKKYPRANEFIEYGEKLWDRIKNLPRGFSHGDMYSGNIVRNADGKLYILDFDTSCLGFPTYDLALICNQTHYFDYDTEGFSKTTDVYNDMLPGYLKYHKLTEQEITSLYDMIALYHLTLQATMIEIYGLDCVDNAFFDKQLNWLMQWEKQYKNEVNEEQNENRKQHN